MAGFTLQGMYLFARGNKRALRSGGRVNIIGETKGVQRDELHKEGDTVSYLLWGHPIAILNTKTNVLKVSDCGYLSKTTKERLNQVIPKGGIYQKDYRWYYSVNGKDVSWPGKMEFKVPVKMRG